MGVGDQRHAPAALPLGKETRYPLYRKLGGFQSRSGRVRKISPPLGFDARNVQPVASRYTDWECENIISWLKGNEAESLAEYLTLLSQNFRCEILSFISGVAVNPDLETSSSDFLPEGGDPQ
jgi:hypothetical protein